MHTVHAYVQLVDRDWQLGRQYTSANHFGTRPRALARQKALDFFRAKLL